VALTVLLATATFACTTDADEQSLSENGSLVISHETTRDISVWVPHGEGPWPVVYALHGLGGHRDDLAEVATNLADQGILVFSAQHSAPDWAATEHDVECGYRFVRTMAGKYGGDLEQPVTFVGFSVGATLVLHHGLADDAFGPGGTFDACFSGAPRPDIIVPISGCHYEYQGATFGFDTVGWSNQKADLVLIAGEKDSVCEAWQSQDAASVLASSGYDVRLNEIAGANHLKVIFHDFVDDQWLTVPDEPAGHEVVQTILEAIATAEK
jgi:predicted esterase